MADIIQVSVSRGGVPKRALAEAMITSQGLDGDSWAHPQFHGGEDQKVLIISAEVIDDLAARGFPVFYGALGENLTVRGVDFAALRAGQTWRAGDAMLELTKVRVPCATLDVYRHADGRKIQKEIYDARVKKGDSESPVWAHSGFYAAVRRMGRVSQGAPFELMFQSA
jgi:MOSC domain-containing protein YiiM